MSKLNISPNLFLEVNELSHLIKFLGDDGFKSYFKYLCKSFGIAQNSDNTFYKVSRKNESSDTVIINSGIAFDSNLNRIYLGENKELVIPNTGVPQWIVISYATTNDEVGTVNISAQGALSGNGTKFLSVLRGQPNFPTKVKFNSKVNTEEYEVVDVSSDTIATLTGAFKAENGLKYQVIGTFTPGFQPNDFDKTIYEYDSCKIDIIESEDKPEVSEGQFIVACITYVNGTISVSDERIRNLFNYELKIDEDVNSNNLQSDPFVALRQTTLRNERILDVQFEWGYTVTRFELISTADQNIFSIVTGNSNYLSSSKIPDGIFAGWLLVNRKNMVSCVVDNNNGNSLIISKFNPLLVTNEGDDEFVVVPNVKDIEVEVTLKRIKSNTAVTVNNDNEVEPSVETTQSRSLGSALGNRVSSNWTNKINSSTIKDLIDQDKIIAIKPTENLNHISAIWGDKLTVDNFRYDISSGVLIGTVDKTLIDKEELVALLDTTEYGNTKYFYKFSIDNAKSRFSLPIDYGQTLIELRYRIMTLSETTKFQPFANSQFTNVQGNKETLGDSSFIIIINKPEADKRNYS